MLEVMIIALLMPGMVVIFAVAYWSAKRLSANAANAAKAVGRAEKVDLTSAALPINRCQLARVRQVVDGDSVIVATPTRELHVRLGAIDCPEKGQHWGDIATLGLIKLVGGRLVAFEDHGIDNSGRTIATIYVRDVDNQSWTDVNARMVACGHAWVLRRHYRHLPYSRRAEFNRLERWAQRKRIGLWKSHNLVPPWQLRAGNGWRFRVCGSIPPRE